MNRKLTTPCPGCGAVLFALSIASEEKGVAKLHAEPSPYAKFVRLETVEAVCANGCEVTVRRESGEHTAKQLQEIGALPAIALALAGEDV